jgi:hypothetical protein
LIRQIETVHSLTKYETPLVNLSFAPLPNPLLRGEGKGIIFNTGEALNLVLCMIKKSSF